MGVEQSTLYNESGLPVHSQHHVPAVIGDHRDGLTSPSISIHKPKPNKIKKYNHFHSKPSHVVDLIVNKDWQKLLIATAKTSHQKEIFIPQKVRLFGMDRKVLPLHLACAMSPPLEVIEALLLVDKTLMTVQTPMKNCKKRLSKGGAGGGGGKVGNVKTQSSSTSNNHIHNPSTFYNGAQHHKIDTTKTLQSSIHSSNQDSEKDDFFSEGVFFPSTTTPTTETSSEPRSSFDTNSDIGKDELHPSLSTQSFDNSSSQQRQSHANFFFSENTTHTTAPATTLSTAKQHPNEYYALQLTPSGDVKQISPNGKYCRSVNDTTESPFSYVATAQSEEEKHSYPSSLADDFLPLHIACLFKASPAVIELLIQSYPAAVEMKNKWGMLPIHIVCSNISLEPPKIASKKAVDEFTSRRYLTTLYADTISDRNEVGWEIEKVVEVLVDSFPQSVNIPSDNIEWLTPIEYIGRNFPNGDEKENLLNLLKWKRNSYKGENIYGRLDTNMNNMSSCNDNISLSREKTLLYSYVKAKDWDNVHEQVNQHPDEASCWVADKDYDNSAPALPIHLACSYSAPVDIIHALMDAYPDGLKSRGKHGFNPLHIACKKSLNEKIILEIIQICPEAVSQKDEYGRLPLHLACQNSLPFAVIRALIESYPNSCTVKDYNGHTAITYFCIHNDAIDDEVGLLFERYDGSFSNQYGEVVAHLENGVENLSMFENN